jgi:hypothetical protein
MARRIEPLDLMVAVGVFATVLGGYFLFMAANGTLEAGQPQRATVEETTAAMGPMAAMEWVQPALGQALVQNYLSDRTIMADIEAAAKELNRISLLAQQMQDVAGTSGDDLSARMMELDADHAARVQYILGRSLVVLTGRGVRSGLLSPVLIDGPYNQRMITLTQARAQQMDAAYQENRQPMLGRMIVAIAQAAHETVRVGERVQDSLGRAIIRIASLQEENQAKAEAQTQLALLIVASIHTEEVAERFDSLVKAETSTQPISTVFSAPRTWPEIPTRLLMAGSIGLIGLFCGLIMRSNRPEDELPTMAEVSSEPVYRKTA